MKKIAAILISFFLLGTFSISAMDSSFNKPSKSHPRPVHHNNKSHGAPLDGGILAVLGAAGIVYYTTRKKKGNPED